MNIKNFYTPDRLLNNDFSELNVNYEREINTIWCYMNASPRPCFTPGLLSEFDMLQDKLLHPAMKNNDVKYLVAASKTPGVFNLGGDLDYFSHCIESSDRTGLTEYAYACVDLSYAALNQFGKDITSIALVQGNALGGGFECALSCNTIVAEESSRLGFPEILFNLFPGMGAYSFLSRRVSMHVAEEIIMSGKMYTAEELYELGVVDVLVRDGDGERAVRNYIQQHSKKYLARVAMHKAKMLAAPITQKELHDITDVWVEAALKVDRTSLKVMQRLIRAQTNKMKDVERMAVVS
ncbi:MAG: crotonase/enoyl-CoA hydratase family protein [Gammaproteobacteria bacterium]|nr:crotonase/enoyl-CoA hydratase family protein [Gammaproteobacteria bacterium]